MISMTNQPGVKLNEYLLYDVSLMRKPRRVTSSYTIAPKAESKAAL